MPNRFGKRCVERFFAEKQRKKQNFRADTNKEVNAKFISWENKITNRKSEQIVNADISAEKTPKMRFRQIVQNYECKTIYDSRSCTTAAKNIECKGGTTVLLGRYETKN